MKNFLKTILALGITIIIGLSYQYFLKKLKDEFSNFDIYNWSISEIILIPVFIFVIFLIIVFFYKSNPKNYLNLYRISNKKILKWIGVFVLYIFIYILLFHQYFPKDTFEKNFPITLIIIYFLASCIFVPIFEEIICRGFLFKNLQQIGLSIEWVIGLVIIIFTFFHGPSGLFLIPVSFIYTFARYKTNSTITPMILHFLNNFIFFLAEIYYSLYK